MAFLHARQDAAWKISFSQGSPPHSTCTPYFFTFPGKNMDTCKLTFPTILNAASLEISRLSLRNLQDLLLLSRSHAYLYQDAQKILQFTFFKG